MPNAKAINMILDVENSQLQFNNYIFTKNCSIGNISGGMLKNTNILSEVSNADFAKALITTLNNFGIINQRQDQSRYILNVAIIEITYPFDDKGEKVIFHLSQNIVYVKSTIEYQLIDKNNDSTIFHEKIATTAKADNADSWQGPVRFRIANEKSVKLNIQKFIKKLDTIQLAK